MSSPENPGESGKPGPLDELFPHLKQPKEELPRLPVHARVLEVPEPAGTVLVVVVWSDPGTSLSLHQEVRQRFEGTLLAELSRPASELLAEELRPRALRVVVVGKARSDLDRALGAFGLVRTKPEGSSWNETLAYVRGEAPRVGEPVPEDFDSFWEVAIHTAPGERGEITVTGGCNPLLPLLRYRTGDFARMEHSGGRVWLRELEGRPPVPLLDAAGGEVNTIDVSRALAPFALAQIHLHQESDRALTLSVRGEADHALLEATLRALFGALPITVRPLVPPASPGDKVLQYTSAVAPPAWASVYRRP